MRRCNYAKIILSFVFLFGVSVLFSDCCTCGKLRADTTSVVSGNSYAAGKLEATVAALDGTVADSRERIANIIKTSRGITDGVERVEYLFTQYESEVERILGEIDRIRDEAQIPAEDNNSGGNNTSAGGGSPGSASYTENQVRDKDSVSS